MATGAGCYKSYAPINCAFIPMWQPSSPQVGVLSHNTNSSLLVDFSEPEDRKPEGDHGAPVTEYNVQWTQAPELMPDVFTVATVASKGDIKAGSFYVSFNSVGPMGKSLGKGSIVTGTRFVTTEANLQPKILRGDKIRVGSETYIVSTDAADTFNTCTLPLDSYYTDGNALQSGSKSQDVTLFRENTWRGTATYDKTAKVFKWVADAEKNTLGGLANGDILYVFIDGEMAAQTVTVVSSDSFKLTGTDSFAAGTYSIYDRRLERREIKFDATAADLDASLEELAGVGSVEVERTGPNKKGEYVWTITFSSLVQPCPSGSCLQLENKDKANPGFDLKLVKTRTGKFPAQANWQTGKVTGSAKLGGVQYETQAIETFAKGPITGYMTWKICQPYCNHRSDLDSDPVCDQCVDFEFSVDVTAEDIRRTVEHSPHFGRVDVTRTQKGFGYRWDFTFLTNLGDAPEILIDSSKVQGTGFEVTNVELKRGVRPATTYKMQGLAPGTSYYVRVLASNQVGQGTSTLTEQSQGLGVVPVSRVSATAPDAPEILSLAPLSNSRAKVDFSQPDKRGEDILSYKVEWYSASKPLQSDVQIITLTVSKCTTEVKGSFYITYLKERTPALPYNATKEQVETAIDNFITLGNVEVILTKTDTEFKWAVTFVGDIGNVAQLGVHGQDLRCAAVKIATTQNGQKPLLYGVYELSDKALCGLSLDSIETGVCNSGVRHRQSILTEAASAMGGTFDLWYQGKIMSRIDYDISATELEKILQPQIKCGSITVTRTTRQNGFEWEVSADAICGKVEQLVVNGDRLTGDEASIAVYQRVNYKTTAQRDDISGSYTLEINGEETASLAFAATADQVRVALEALDSVGRVIVQRTTSTLGKGDGYGFEWSLLFKVQDGDLGTFRVKPGTDWRGTGVSISVDRPNGVKPYSFMIGSDAEVQTFSVLSAKPISQGSFKLQLGAEKTACLQWNAMDADVKAELEKMQAVDTVDVVRNGNGQQNGNFGYVYYVTFYGAHYDTDSVGDLKVSSDQSGCAALKPDNEVVVFTDVLINGVALSEYNNGYTALKSSHDYVVLSLRPIDWVMVPLVNELYLYLILGRPQAHPRQ